jgi:hypothetical protein
MKYQKDATKHHVKVGELVNLINPKATPRHKVVKIQGDKIHIQKDGDGAIQIFPLERVKRVKAATYKHQQSKLATEEMEVELELMRKGKPVKEAKETDAEMEDEDGDGEKDKKKKKGKFEKYDIVNTKPSDNKTMMQTDEEC